MKSKRGIPFNRNAPVLILFANASLFQKFFILGVPDDFTFNQVNHFFGDIGGMIRQALKVPGD